MGEIGSDTDGVNDIVQSELSNVLARLEEEGQWLMKLDKITHQFQFSIPVQCHLRHQLQQP